MTPQKQHKLFLAKQAFERQATYLRTELRVCDRTDHLQPVLDFLEWLVRDMADLAGTTLEVKAYAQAQSVLRGQVASRAQELTLQRIVGRPQPAARPKLRLVKS